MKFPVDLLADVSQTELERLAQDYMNDLLYSNPDAPEHLTLADSTKVTIDISIVGFVPLYGSSDRERILALFSPDDPLTAVALYLLDRWWTVDDIARTADSARDGALEVETVGERIVLYILNRVIYRSKEMSSEELPFLLHGENDHAKILWSNGEAVGFYSVKPEGSLCNSFSTRSYQLPVMDSVFVRKRHRGNGFGLQMLEDFVLCSKEDCLGLRYPLTKSMLKVCEKYLGQYPGDSDLLWEVQSVGGPNQRTRIASKIQAMDKSVSRSLTFTEESLVITERTEKDVMEAITTKIKEAASMECTVEIVEGVTVLSPTKDAEVPLTARGRSSGRKVAEGKSEKVIRIEDIEAESPREELHISELMQTECVSGVERGDDVVDAAAEEAALISDRPAAVRAPQDPEEAAATSAPVTEDPQAAEEAPRDLNTSLDSQITVENVASEMEACQEEEAAALVVSGEVLEIQKEAETLDKVEEGTQMGITDEQSEEGDTQHEESATLENGEAENTGRTSVKAEESKTPRRRSTRHSKLEEETTAQEGGIMLRRRALRNTPQPERKYTRRSQKVSEELEEEADEVTEEKDGSTAEVEEELAATEGGEQEEATSIKEDAVENAPEEVALISDQPPTVQATQDPEEAGVTSSPTTEDEAPRDVNDTSGDAQITVENVTSEIEKDAAAAVVSEEVLEIQKEAETLDKVGEGTQIGVTDEQSEDGETQYEAENTRRTVESQTPRRRSKRHSKLEEETTAQDGGIILRGRVLRSTQQPKRKYTRHSQKVCEELEEEAEEKEVEEELAVTGGEMKQLEDEQLTNEEKREEQVEDSQGKVSSTDLPETAPTKEGEDDEVPEEVETAVLQDKQDVPDDEIEEPTAEAPASHGKADEQMEEHHLVEGEGAAPTEEPTVVKEHTIPKAAEAGEDVTPPCEVNAEVQEEEESSEAEPETVSVMEEEAVGVTGAADGEPDAVAAASETVTPVEVLNEAVVPAAEEPQKRDMGPDIPKLQNAAIVLVDIKTTSHHVSMKEAEETAAEGESAAPEKQQEAEDGKEEANSAEQEAEAMDTGELSGGSKQQEEDNMGEGITDTEVDEANTCTNEVEGEMEAADAVTVPAEENQPAVSEMCADGEAADVPVGDDAAENLPAAEEEVSLEEEETPVVETVTLRRRTKTSTATPRRKSTRSRKQADAQEAENSEEEEEPPAVETRTLRRGRVSASHTPKVKSKRGRKQIQEEEQKGGETLTSAEERGGEEEEEAAVEKVEEKEEEEAAVEKVEEKEEEAAVEKVEEEEEEAAVEKVEEKEEEEAAVEKVEEEEEAAVEKVEEEEEAAVEKVKEEEEASVEKVEEEEEAAVEQVEEEEEEEAAVEQVEEEEAAVKKVEEEEEEEAAVEQVEEEEAAVEKVEEKEEEEAAVEKVEEKEEEEAAVEKVEEKEEETVEEEAAPEREEGLDPDVDVKEGEAVAENRKGAEEDPSEEGTVTEEEEKTAAADDVVQGEPEAPEPATDSAELPPSEEEATPSAEEQQGEVTAPQLSDLRRVTVVLVDMHKPHHYVQEETAAAEEGLPVAETAAEAEEEQREETMEEEDVPGSPVGIEKTELEKVEEEGFDDKVEAVKIQDGAADEAAKEEEATSVDDEEEEPAAPETTTQRSRKETVDITPSTKLRRGRPKKGEVRKEAPSGMQKEEPEAEVRVLRRGRKSIPVTQRSTTKRTRKQLQEEEEEEEESTAVEVREAEVDQQQTMDQEKGERVEERDAAQEVENIEAEIEKEEAVIQQDAPKKADSAQTDTGEDQIEEKACDEAAAQEDESPEPEAVEAVAGDHLTEVEPAVSERCADGQDKTSIEEGADETPNTEEEKVTDEEKAPTVEMGGLSSEKKQNERQDDEEEEEKSTVEDEPAAETRVLRKGRKSAAAAAPRQKSKRARTQLQTEEEEEEKEAAEEIEGEEEEAGQESAEEKVEEEAKSVDIEKDKEEEEVNDESAEEDAENMEDDTPEEAAVLDSEEAEGIVADTVQTSSAEVEETNSPEEEETAVVEKSTAAAEVGSDTAVAGEEEEEAVDEDEPVGSEDEAPAVTPIKTSHVTRSKRQKDRSLRRSVRKRPRVDYRENDEGDRGEAAVAAGEEEKEHSVDEEEVNKKADSDEDVETAVPSPEDEEDEQSASEEEAEPVVIGKRVLRGRSVPSVIITPQAKSRRSSAAAPNEGKSLRSARKRGSTGETQTRKRTRLSRV